MSTNLKLKNYQREMNRPDACLLFVYGSLLTGTPSPRINSLLKRHCRTIAQASIAGRLYEFGRYPGAIASGNKTDKVYGNLLYVNKVAIISLIDKYEQFYPACLEKSEFIRKRTQVSFHKALRPAVHAWCYYYNGSMRMIYRIKCGKYPRLS
jgi:gamma-glutamylcyclotransferase (GGCT)/AIG2-like uncharacterized protein YtfP